MSTKSRVGLIVFAHGSRVTEANEAVRRTAREAAARCGMGTWETAFLELAPPDLETAVKSLVDQGAAKIVVVPYFLTLGIHLQRDLPAIVDRISRIHPGVEIVCTGPLDGHPALVDILAERAREVIRS